jgi:hypothetical protein
MLFPLDLWKKEAKPHIFTDSKRPLFKNICDIKIVDFSLKIEYNKGRKEV